MQPLDPTLLGPAIEAARRAMRRMEDKHVPPRLRLIAARSGRLPAPLLKRLLTELDGSEWLRAEARAILGEHPEAGGPDHEASLLFLDRPTGWEKLLAEIAAGRAGEGAQDQIKRLEGQLRRAIARASKLEKSLVAAESSEQAVRVGVDARIEALLVSQKKAAARHRALTKKLRQQAAGAEATATRLDQENGDLRAQLKLARAKASKGEPSPIRPEKATAWTFGKPADLGRHLDDLNRAAMVAPTGYGESETSIPSEPLTGPPTGIRPDRAEAIEWLLGLSGLVRVAIDGWNAAHLLESPPDPKTRNRIIEAARRINLASAGKRIVTTVFDSSQVGESFAADDVIVTFVASADDELIEMANRDPERLVIVTSDRRVRESAERAGAVGLWSEALIDWLRTHGRRTFRP
ncbi:MAG: hypothetical protein ACRDWH_00795 [Acidimicrobiia bacterium]